MPTPAAHAPEQTRARRWLGAVHVTGVLWYRLHGWAARALPEPLVAAAIAIWTPFFFLTLFRIRSAIGANLEAVLGRCGFVERQRRIWRTLWNFAWCQSERYERLGTQRRFEVRLDGERHWHEVADTGGGFVLATAHVGNYEVGSMLPSTEEARSVVLVREREASAAAQDYIEGLLEKLPGASRYRWHFEDDGPLQALPLLEALRRNEIVAVQGDRPRTGSQTVSVELFGRPFDLPAGPATLARLAEVPMLPVFMLREGRRSYRLVFREPITVDRQTDRRTVVAAALGRLAADIEWAIREEPHQWFCFRPVFDRPSPG